MNLAEIKIDNEMYTIIAIRIEPPVFRKNNDNVHGFDNTAGHLVVEYEAKVDFTKRSVKQVN